MYIYQKKTIISRLPPMQILSLVENSGQFIAKIENTKFTVRERIFMSNKVLLPVLTGVVDEQNDNTLVDVAFELSKSDKLGLGLFLFVVFFLSLLLGFVSSDIILAITLISFGSVLVAVFLARYVYNCRRAFKKIACLLESTN